jgi:hypothetical protein
MRTAVPLDLSMPLAQSSLTPQLDDGAAVMRDRCVAPLLALAGHPHLLPKTGAFT